jgi:DNA-binding NtrC family response regulator
LITTYIYTPDINVLFQILDLGKDHSHTADDNRRSILVTDDEYDIVNLIKQSLEKRGQKVCGFSDAKAALDHFTSNKDKHGIVISDLRMPGMNGYEFVTQIKKNDPEVKVVLMSAFKIQEKEFHNVLPDIKVDAFLQKPFTIGQLNDVVLKMGT